MTRTTIPKTFEIGVERHFRSPPANHPSEVSTSDGIPSNTNAARNWVSGSSLNDEIFDAHQRATNSITTVRNKPAGNHILSVELFGNRSAMCATSLGIAYIAAPIHKAMLLPMNASATNSIIPVRTKIANTDRLAEGSGNDGPAKNANRLPVIFVATLSNM